MTEEEAAQTRCHKVPRDPKTNPLPMHPHERCIASACMAWRWGQTAGEGPFKMDYGTGYCGLAGGTKP